LLARLDLERYKATIKGLAQFGDRRQGTDRNRKAVDWIEAELKSYGCPTERLTYEYKAPPPNPAGRGASPPRPSPVIASGEVPPGQGGSRLRGLTRPTGGHNDPNPQPGERPRVPKRTPAKDGPQQQGQR